jgi:hypothetical protein
MMTLKDLAEIVMRLDKFRERADKPMREEASRLLRNIGAQLCAERDLPYKAESILFLKWEVDKPFLPELERRCNALRDFINRSIV